MIPLAQITQWRQIAPWSDDFQVEQDLILSRTIVEIFSDPFLSQQLAFRGGTALHKLFFSPPARYSEDIDLVRTTKGGIKEIIDALRARLEPWLGQPKTRQTAQSFKLLFYFNPETSPTIKLRVKIEINIHENFSVLARFNKHFSVTSDWFTGNAQINTFHFEELLATKLRALYERSKGRDAFDLWLAIQEKNFDVEKTIAIFLDYMAKGNKTITQKLFISNLDLKLNDHSFLADIQPLLSPRQEKSHSRQLRTQKDDPTFIVTEDNRQMITEGWSVVDAVEAIKNVILVHLPR